MQHSLANLSLFENFNRADLHEIDLPTDRQLDEGILTGFVQNYLFFRAIV